MRKQAARWLYGLFAIAGCVLLGWIWWQSGKKVPPSAPPPAPTLTRTTAPLPSLPGLTPVIRSNGVIIPVAKTVVATNPAPPRVVTNATVPRVPAPNLPATNLVPVAPPASISWTQVLAVQIALVSQGISPGSLDGVMGGQTHAALRAFQRKEGLPATGQLNERTLLRLARTEPILTNYCITSSDLARLLPVGRTWLAKSEQSRLDYDTILELVAEKFQSHPALIRQLNPDVEWTRMSAGRLVRVPNIEPPVPARKAGLAKIFLAARALEVFDADTNLLAHFPCSIARLAAKRPVGELQVATAAPNPNYTFNPEIFPESAEGRELGRKLVLPPGPNSPVGVAWIGLDKPGYGIHGTPHPEQVGRTESHGCFRLANWNADYLMKLVWVGMPVFVEP